MLLMWILKNKRTTSRSTARPGGRSSEPTTNNKKDFPFTGAKKPKKTHSKTKTKKKWTKEKQIMPCSHLIRRTRSLSLSLLSTISWWTNRLLFFFIPFSFPLARLIDSNSLNSWRWYRRRPLPGSLVSRKRGIVCTAAATRATRALRWWRWWRCRCAAEVSGSMCLLTSLLSSSASLRDSPLRISRSSYFIRSYRCARWPV